MPGIRFNNTGFELALKEGMGQPRAGIFLSSTCRPPLFTTTYKTRRKALTILGGDAAASETGLSLLDEPSRCRIVRPRRSPTMEKLPATRLPSTPALAAQSSDQVPEARPAARQLPRQGATRHLPAAGASGGFPLNDMADVKKQAQQTTG
jgi:hypothetical protein